MNSRKNELPTPAILKTIIGPAQRAALCAALEDQSALIFVRAATRDAAKAEVQRVMPQARFHR